MAWWKRSGDSPEQEPTADGPSFGDASASATDVPTRWDYTDEPNHLFRGRPFLFLDLPDPPPLAPLYLITALVKRPDKDLLVFVFDNHVDQKRAAGPDDPQLPAPRRPARDPDRTRGRTSRNPACGPPRSRNGSKHGERLSLRTSRRT